jgi:hypothetical protein
MIEPEQNNVTSGFITLTDFAPFAMGLEHA